MILTYYKGANFGDAINPLIFNHLLPGFFNDDPAERFLGIGSILGFEKGDEKTRKLIVFSSGFAYDEPPVINERYDIRCVRGPMTASVLKIDKSKAVTDGALLLRQLPVFQSEQPKKYKFSYIPHFHTEQMFDRWEQVFTPMGINYISPAANPVDVIQQIRQSECVIAEAMHAAIIADTFRIPWFPVKMSTLISAFKWQDWIQSMEIGDYKPESLPRIYDMKWIQWIMWDKLKVPESSSVNKLLSRTYRGYQNLWVEKKIRNLIKTIVKYQPFLSKDSVIMLKEEQLLDILENTKNDYS